MPPTVVKVNGEYYAEGTEPPKVEEPTEAEDDADEGETQPTNQDASDQSNESDDEEVEIY